MRTQNTIKETLITIYDLKMMYYLVNCGNTLISVSDKDNGKYTSDKAYIFKETEKIRKDMGVYSETLKYDEPKIIIVYSLNMAIWLMQCGNEPLYCTDSKKDPTKRIKVFGFQNTPKLKNDMSKFHK